jgi:dolichol-phosphate mannosyltransferase
MVRVAELYRNRFSAKQRETRDRVWEILCCYFFQRYVREEDTTLDLGCGFGEFSRFIRARHRIAVDVNPDAGRLLPSDVEFHEADARRLEFLSAGSIDVCFTSNFFEHLPSKLDLDVVLSEVVRVLRPGGRLVALQPNIRYAPGEYWDFYDHHVPLSHLSCAEAFAVAGLEVVELVDRFLPFSSCSPTPQHPALVRLYLWLPPVWRMLGRQFLIVGQKNAGEMMAGR